MNTTALMILIGTGVGLSAGCGEGERTDHSGSVEAGGAVSGDLAVEKAACDSVGGELLDCAYLGSSGSPRFKCGDTAFEWDDKMLDCVVLQKSELSARELCGLTGGSLRDCGSVREEPCDERQTDGGYNCICPYPAVFDQAEGCGELIYGECNTPERCPAIKSKLCLDGAYGRPLCTASEFACELHVCKAAE